MPREVHATRLLALRRGELPARVVALYKDVAIGILGVFAELDVAPLQGNQLPFPQTRTQRGEKERVPLRAYLPNRFEKIIAFVASHCACLALRFFATDEVSHSRRWIPFDQSVLDRGVENDPQGASAGQIRRAMFARSQ